MSWSFDVYQRIEPNPARTDLDEGLRARVADPLWFLTRQWQLQEHRGEDAASPVRVDYVLTETPLTHATLGSEASTTPSEAIVEAEPDSWWTVGRRVLVGRRIGARATAEGIGLVVDDSVTLGALPPPYDLLDPAGFDGRKLAAARAELGLSDDWFAPEALAALTDSWDPSRFEYRSDDLAAGGATMRVERHDGGSLGWYSFAAEASPQGGVVVQRAVVPTRLRYPGAPNPRWWELESSATDIGAYSPDRAHFATLLLIEIVTAHSDNWFTIPVTGTVGTVATISNASVIDVFGDDHPIAPPADWHLFETEGLTNAQLVIAPVALNPLEGEPIERVDVAIDEQANVLWAVERRVDSQEIDSLPPAVPVRDDRTADPTHRQTFSYRPNRPVPAGWHPYVLDSADGIAVQRFIQARLADLNGPEPELTPQPSASLLRDPAADAEGRHPHEIVAAVIPVRGLELTRRSLLARRTDGKPVLWRERRAAPRPGWVSTELAFDMFEVD